MIIQRDLIYIGILALAVMAWFHPFFLRGEMLIPPNSTYPWYNTEFSEAAHPQASMDALRENYITWALHHNYLAKGYAPNWQPYFLAGNPLLANQFSIPYSPYKLLNFFLSAPVAWSWAIILKSFLNGFFTYLALRRLSRGHAAATIGALAWMLSWPLAHQTQTTYNEGVAWVPALFFCLLSAYQMDNWRGRLAYAIPAAGVAGFQMLAGNIQMTIYSALFLGAFALWAGLKPSPTRFIPILIFLGVYAAGTLMGAVQLGPSYELINESIRGASQTHVNKGIEPYTEISFFNPWIYYWRNFEFPDLRVKYWLTYRWNPYIGLLPLFMVGVAAFLVRESFARALLYFTGGIFVVLHVVYWRPIFELVSRLPAYDAVEQTRLLILLMFPLALLAAYGVDWVLDFGSTQTRPMSRLLGLGALILPLLVLGLLALMLFFRGELEAVQGLGDSFAEQRSQIGTKLLADYYHFKNPLLSLTFFWSLGGLALLVAYMLGKVPRPVMEWLLIALTACDLVIFAQVNVASTEQVYPPTPAIQFLQAQMSEDIFRISAAPNRLHQGQSPNYANYRADHSWFMSSLMPPLMPNTPALFGLQDLRGYESVYTLKYSQYMAALDGRETPFSAVVTPESVSHPMLDLLNMRYVLSIEPLDEPNLKLVYENEIRIYENQKTLPRVMLYADFTLLESPQAVLAALTAPDFDPKSDLYFSEAFPQGERGAQGQIQVSAYEPNRVLIQSETESDSILVLLDENYPDWRAYIDGKETPIYTANYLFRAIELPAGQHQVEFRYESRVIRAGTWVSALSAAFLLAVWLGLWWWK